MLARRAFSLGSLIVAAGLLTCGLGDVARSQEKGAPVAGAKAGAPVKQYSEHFLPEHPDWKSLRAKFNEKGTTENDAEAKVFTAHYNSLASELTQYSGARNTGKISERGDKIAEARIKLKNDLLMFAKGGKPSTGCHDALVEQLSKMLPNLFNSDKYHPVTRVNALLLYGDLNSKEGDAGLVPLASAYPVLLKVFTTNTQPGYLRVTALGGLARHAEAGPTPEASKELTAEMVKLLKAPPPGFKPEVYDFLRLRAVEILRNLAMKRSEANTKEIAGLLYSIVQDKNGKNPLDLRCEALRAMGALDGRLIGDSSVRGIAQTYAKLAIEIARQAVPPEEEEGDDGAVAAAPAPPRFQRVARSPNAFVSVQEPAAEPPGQAAPADAAPEVAEEPEEDKGGGGLAPDVQTYMLGCVATALTGVDSKRGLAASATDAKNKKFITDINSNLGDIWKVVRLKKHGDKLSAAEFDKMQESIKKLEKVLNEGQAAPAAAE